MADKLEVLINGEKKLEKEIECINPEEIIRTIEMILDYAKLHKGSKIGMLKGINKLR